MKKFLSIALSVIMLICALPANTAFAQNGDIGSITLTASKTNVNYGDEITFTYSITPSEPLFIASYIVGFLLPDGLEYIDGTVENIGPCTGSDTKTTDSDYVIFWATSLDDKYINTKTDLISFKARITKSDVYSFPILVSKPGFAYSKDDNVVSYDFDNFYQTIYLNHEHSLNYQPAVNATCLKNGNTAYYECTLCKRRFTDSSANTEAVNTTIAKVAHSLTYYPAVDATCTKQGSIDYYFCSKCNKKFKDKAATKEITNTKTDTIDHKCWEEVTKKATFGSNGILAYRCYECGVIDDEDQINKVSAPKLSKKSYTYDGKAKTPSVKVYYYDSEYGEDIDLSKGKDYKLTYSSGRTKVGKYSVKVTLMGDLYSGTKTLYYTVKPKSTSISSLTAARKGFTAKWKKQATQTTGYEIQIATNSKFSKGVKKYTVAKTGTVSKKITKLTGKKKYYVRIRTYKTVSGTKYYSSWSKAKTVTTKK